MKNISRIYFSLVQKGKKKLEDITDEIVKQEVQQLIESSNQKDGDNQ